MGIFLKFIFVKFFDLGNRKDMFRDMHINLKGGNLDVLFK